MNIGDIAELAGVSRAAVSRYLNNGYLSEEKRLKISKVIEETGYKPSITAQMLRTKKTRLIGVVLPRIRSDSISSIVEGIESVLEKTGYEMLLACTDNSPEKELNYLETLLNRNVDGIILVATVFTEAHRALLSGFRIPLVIIGQKISGFHCVYHDDRGAGRELTELMISRGKKKILYIGVLKEDVAVGSERLKGYLEAMEAHHLNVTDKMTATAVFSRESGYEKMGELLSVNPDAEAVICATDGIATGAMICLKERGFRLPEDFALAGFGDNAGSVVTSPAITTIHFYYRESGETAASQLMEQMDGKGHPAAEICFGYELKDRESVQ